MRRSPTQLIFAVLVLGMLLLREAQAPPLAGIEEAFVNWLTANSNGAHSRAPVTLVEIDDNCLASHPWPWSPLDYASFLDGVLQFQPRAVGIEPVLAWDEKKLTPDQMLKQPQYETILHERILRMPKLELGAELGFPADPDVLPPIQPLPVLRNVEGPTQAVPEYTVIEAEPGEDIRLTTSLGFANVPPTEPTARHAPLVFRYRGQMVPSFVLEAMMLWYGVMPDEVTVRLGSTVRLGDKLTVPVDDAGAMLVDWKQPYDRAGYDDLLLAVDQLQAKHALVVPQEKLKDRLVVLARTDSRSRTLQLPTGQMGSPGELFAEALATAETSAFARPAGWMGAGAVLLLGVAMSWTVTKRRKLWVAPIVVGFGAGYLLICLGVFEATRVALPVTPMLGLAVFVGVYQLLEAGPRR